MAVQGKTKLVAIVDDDDSVRSALQGMLKAVGLPALAFGSAEEFLSSGQQHHTACLITDMRMPGISGLELQAKLNANNCRIPTIFITAHLTVWVMQTKPAMYFLATAGRRRSVSIKYQSKCGRRLPLCRHSRVQ
jgi:FixJ family two-component response regulator